MIKEFSKTTKLINNYNVYELLLANDRGTSLKNK